MLNLTEVSVVFQKVKAVKSVSLSLAVGEIACLLGPSGCGKTTLLRAIAGFEPITSGQIILDQIKVSDARNMVLPEMRNIGMVFQDFALFPHLNLEENIKFGIRHLSRSEQKQRVDELLALIEMSGLNQRYPHELSGGQQQRIALARALAPRPKLLLLDEPFSSMDVDLRQELTLAVRRILKQENTTALMVTHDQNEAFAMADKIGVMRDGKLLQWDTGYDLYHQPQTSFVADFIGEGVLIPGTIIEDNKIKTDLMVLEGKVPEGCQLGGEVQVLIRPDDIVHDDCSPRTAVIKNKFFRGSNYLYVLEMSEGIELLSMVHSHHDHAIGESLGIILELEHLVVFPK